MTARRSKLRVATESDAPPEPSVPMTVAEAAEKGTHRDVLVAIRARIAVAVDGHNTPAVALAALTRQLRDLSREIKGIDAQSDLEEHAAVSDDVTFDYGTI